MTDPDQKMDAGRDAARVELLPPSFTMRVGNRRLTMSWRPRKPVPSLLTGLLRRSWRAMFGNSLRISMTAAAICAAWNVPALAAAPPVNTLPTGGIITSGTATITQNGNTLNINQSSNQAIGNFTSFSIGANATVDISQPNSAAAFLARVTGTDPSLIYGLLKSNGTVALINQNGIMVGPGGVVDVARFIASTLNVTDSDFLAGKLTFTAGTTVGNVDNQGTIKTATGGSVYLIGANVSNSGVIQSPNGEILLAAGQTVQLVDTATPGVSVNVTGTTGSVTNLGVITAEAGRIGIAAGLINNSGNINASSVVSEGGRIFLRASQNLTTTASSNIEANGATKGGSVVLYSDKVAYIDGNVSATGAPGQGGYVETSGKQSLDVIKLPTIGSGGTWLIDPYDLEVVSDAVGNQNAYGPVNGVITSIDTGATVKASDIKGMLDSGVSVTLQTGDDLTGSGGNITVNSAINKTSGSAAALTLNADNNIYINADITSTSGALGLNLNTNANSRTSTSTVTVGPALIRLNGGALNVSDSGGTNNGKLLINNGATVDLNQSGTLNAGSVTIATGGSLTSVYNAGVNLAGDLNNSGTVGLNNSVLSVGGKLLNQGTVNLANVSGSLGNVTNTATMTLASMFQGITATAFNNTGSLMLSSGSTLNAGALTNSGTATISASTLNVSSLSSTGTVTATDSSVAATDLINNAGLFTVTNSTINTVNGFYNLLSGTVNLNYLSNIHTGVFNNSGILSANGSAGYVTFENGLDNSGQMTATNQIMSNGSVSNSGTISVTDSYFRVNNSVGNSGHFNITNSQVEASGDFTNNAQGTLNVNYNTTFLTGAVTNLGTMSLDSTANKPNGYTGLTAIGFNNDVTNSGNMTVIGTVNHGSTLTNNGNISLSGASVSFNTVSNNNGASLSGTGTIGASNQFTNSGVISPGGDGVIGQLTINGNFSQTSTGVLNIDVAGASNTDILSIGGTTVQLGGTLQSKLIGGYVPTLDTRLTPIVFTQSNAGGSYFRHVLGDVIGTGNNMQMLKVDYKGTMSLVMSASANLTYVGTNTDTDSPTTAWGTATNWIGGNLPTAIDNVIVDDGVTLTHVSSDGVDTVRNITLNNSAGLGISGGTINVGNISSVGTGTLTLSGILVEGGGGGNGVGSLGLNNGGTSSFNTGTLNLSGTANVSSLSLSNGGLISGGVGSVLNVAGDFSQSGGAINSNGTVALSRTEGNVVVGNITASDLLLTTQGGSITQTDVLHVKHQLTTSSTNGTTLDNSSNQIAAYAGANSANGDIVLVNNLNTTDTSVVRLTGLSNAGGDIAIDNTGAMMLVGNAITPGSVSLVTHSPLTTNGNITAGNGITLAAGVPGSGLANDSIVINGQLNSTSGIISLIAGGSLTVNGNINGAYTPAPLPNPQPIYGAGVTLNGVLVGPPLPVSSTPPPTTTVATDTTSQIDRSVNNTQTTSTSGTPNTGTNPVLDNTQTTGGGADSFGGEDSGTANGQSKPADSGKKVVKLYCS